MSKILRKTAILFAGTAGTNQIAQFGSLAASAPAFSTDPATIQSLSNWSVGWFDGVETGNSPAIEDMNAFCYVDSYQISYLLQQGIPEWDSGTNYFTNSFVQAAGVVYISLQDNNLNNLVSNGSYWAAYQASLAGALLANGTVALTAAWNAGAHQITANSVQVGSAANTISQLATIINSGTLTLPTTTDTLVGRATTDTLTNKTLSAPVFSGTATGVLTTNSFVPTSSTVPTNGFYLAAANKPSISSNSTLGFQLDANQSASIGSTNTVSTSIMGGDPTDTGSGSIIGTVSTNSGGADSAGTFAILRSVSNGVMIIGGDTGITSGAHIHLYGHTHATLPNVMDLKTANVLGVRIDANQNIKVQAGFITSNYQAATPTTGATVTCSANIPGLVITPAGTLATLTIKLPSTPIDGQIVWVASSQTLTAVTWEDAGGTSANVIGGQSTIGGTSRGQGFIYNLANTIWIAIS